MTAAPSPGADEAMLRNRRGMEALARGALNEARLHFEAAIATDPDAPDLWMNHATACRRGGDDAGERAGLLRALDLDQRHFMANVRLAELHERLDEAAQAAARWSLVLGLAAKAEERPAALAALLAHAQAFVAAQQRRFAEAIDGGLATARAGVEPRERRRFDACVDALLGRRTIYRSESAGLHFPFLPADEFFDRDHFPWLAAIEVQADAIRAELAEVRLWDWGVRQDAACARCPVTAAALDALPLAELPRRAPNAHFLMLKPGVPLPTPTGISNVRATVHLPLIVPPHCGLQVGGARRQWRGGEAYAYDDTIAHEAWGMRDALRALLVFEVWNPHLSVAERAALRSMFDKAGALGLDPVAAGLAA